MAAKVVIVAVPTVLGIASIRVYYECESPADGLMTREKLNIYTPLPQSAQAHFVPEKPGFIQSGLTTAREGVLPIAQAVKGACLSVKTGGVNLYHGAEDVFYYLKDPPPGFLPRFGTINMAGLLGMFLARKGSRFKRLALPLGLMGAGASVCYPAQAVSVLKVTGKKVYAVGHWSSASVASLFASKPKDPVAIEIAASPTEAAPVPNPECAVSEETSPGHSATVPPETEVESAEFVPVAEEPSVAVVKEEGSPVTPAETNTDLVVNSVSAETESVPASEESPAPVESLEPSDTKAAAEEHSPAEGETLEDVPSLTESVPLESVPLESVPLESVPLESVPLKSVPLESVPLESVPLESVPLESVQLESSPVETAPLEIALEESAPSSEEPSAPQASEEPEDLVVNSVSAETESVPASEESPAPVESLEPSDTKAAAEEHSPAEGETLEDVPSLTESVPLESVPLESVPLESVPLESVPLESSPVETAPLEIALEESAPSSEEPSAPQEPEVPVVESAEAEAEPQPELADPEPAMEETPSPPPQQPAAENSKDGSGFKADPALMDFGQSSPEDEDLYTTRS